MLYNICYAFAKGFFVSRILKFCLTTTDIAFLMYWALAALLELGVINIPRDMMYADYDDPRVSAWNWSFFPLDIAFAVAGLTAVRAAHRGDPVWRVLAIVSLVLTMTAGGMAVAYWTLMGEFFPAWYISNLVLLVWPMFFLPNLLRETAASRAAPNPAA